MKNYLAMAAAIALALSVSACEKKGPLEQAGEEVDEAVDTMKRGGDESPSNQVDDALDEAREAVQDEKKD